MAWNQVPTFIRDAEGRVLVNPAKAFIQPFELGIDRPNETVIIPASVNRGPFPLSARYDGPIEVFYVKVLVRDNTDATLTDYNIDFLLEHPGKRIQFMPRPIPLIACCGDASRPYILPETIFIPSVQSLNVTFFNRDAAERRVEFVLGGIKYYPHSAPQDLRGEIYAYTQRRERTYTYFLPTDTAPVLAPGATDIQAFSTIPDDADIECFKLTSHSDGEFRVRIADGTNNRGLTSSKQHSSLLFGGHIPTPVGGGVGGSGGMFPARWATTFLARRSTQILYDFDNDTVPAITNTVDTVLGGRKVRYV